MDFVVFIFFGFVKQLQKLKPTFSRGIVVFHLVQILIDSGSKYVADAKPTTLVTIPGLGPVSGLVKTFENASNTFYYQYKAIPYANPVGRFELARAKSSWKEVHDGTKEGPLCPQLVSNPLDEDERNCLRLTVTTPHDPNNLTRNVSVLVFLHGGAFFFGNGRTNTNDPEKLTKEGIIAVQMQYRVGATGWVTDGQIIPKNIGLKDIRLGLEFVQKYIVFFGGNPSRVTLYGHSAGAISGAHLWQSPRTQHLFRAAYFQSGTSINVISVQPDPTSAFKRILKGGPCIFTLWGTAKQQVNCLKLLPAKFLSFASAMAFILGDIYYLGFLSGLTSTAVLEDPSDPEAIVIEKPLKHLISETLPNIPVMVGISSEEMLLFEPFADLSRFRPNKRFVPQGMQAANSNAVGRAIKSQYGGSELGFNLLPKAKIIRAFSDLCMNNAFRKFIEITHNKMAPGSVYCMQFSYASALGKYNSRGVAAHAEDLHYIWNMNDKGREKELRRPFITPEAYRKQSQIIRMVANFVKFLNPTPENDPLLDGFTWPAVSNSSQVECLNFDKKLSVLVNPKDENYQFWNNNYYAQGNPATTF